MLIINILVKDKEILDWWWNFFDIVDSWYFVNWVEWEVVDVFVLVVCDVYFCFFYCYYVMKVKWFGMD